MRHLISTFLFAAIFFTACSYKQEQLLFERKNSPAEVSQTNNSSISSYRIRPQDILQITNAQNNKDIIDETAGVSAGNTALVSTPVSGGVTYTVEDDGTVALAGLGRIQVAGLTRVEARNLIEQLYSKELKKVLLDVKIINLKVSTAGEVKAPGIIPLTKDRTTLIEVIAEAGGLTERADEKHIQIIRYSQNSKVDVIDLSDIKSLADPKAVVENGDIIYVSQNKKAIRNTDIQNFTTLAQPILLIFSTTLLIFTLVRK